MALATPSRSLIPRIRIDGAAGNDPAADGVTAVIAGMAATLGAQGWALTLSAEDAAPTCHAASDPAMETIDALLRIIDQIDFPSAAGASAPLWLEGAPLREGAMALVMPAPPVAGHAPTFVNFVFAGLDERGRDRVERECLRAWPIAAAYFQLWQSARVEKRRAQDLEAGLNFVAIGIVLLGEDGRIVFANEAARGLIARQDGIRERRGQLQATHRGDAGALSSAISYVLAESGSAETMTDAPLLTLTRSSGPPLVASLLPAPAHLERRGEAGALLFFVDPGLDIHELAEPVCKLFRLSRVETELACFLASGHTLASAAEALHVKLGTARGYLKQIFVKTGSNRQVDLVRLIFSNLVRASTSDMFRLR
jgi:DNA-binding CsgD family transcriptional regulator